MNITKEYAGEKIAINDASMKFQVALDGELRSYASYEEAKEAIDKHHDNKKKSSRKKLNISCLGERTGVPVVITGIHAGNGNPLTEPKCSGYDRQTFVIDHPVTRALVQRRLDLEKSIETVTAELSDYRVTASEIPYEAWNESKYEIWANRLEKSAAKALELAQSKEAK